MVLGLTTKDIVDLLTKGLWAASVKQGCDLGVIEQLRLAVFDKLDNANLTCPVVPRCPDFPLPVKCKACPELPPELLAVVCIFVGLLVGYLLSRCGRGKAPVVHEPPLERERELFDRPLRDIFETPKHHRLRSSPAYSRTGSSNSSTTGGIGSRGSKSVLSLLADSEVRR
jgi:hypothetical protein